MNSFPHNQVIGNQGTADPNRSFHDPHQGVGNTLTTNAFGPGQGGFGGGGGGFPTPYQQPSSGGGLANFFKGGAGGGSGFNFAQLKQIVDRMGGIEGVISTLGKVQKMVGTIQQMAPMLKLLIPPKKKSSGGSSSGDGLAPVRRRRRSSSGGKKRRTSGSKGKGKSRR